MLANRLAKSWETRRCSTAIDALMRFSSDGLVLGAGTILVKAGAASRDVFVDPFDPKLCSLLAAAHLRKPTLGSLAHLRRAADCWREGQDAFAAMHLVLSGLDRLERPDEDAHRLFLADELLKGGAEPEAILSAIESGGPAFKMLSKYDPDEPRVPAGSGRTSGQWTSSGGGSPSSPSPSRTTNSRSTGNTSTTNTPRRPVPQTPPRAGSPGFLPTPSRGGVILPYVGDDACTVASEACVFNIGDDYWNGEANDNFEGQTLERLYHCDEMVTRCERMGFVVEVTPFIDRGAAIFPDGGVVLAEKGSEMVYIPRFGKIPPLRGYFRW